MYDRAKLTIDVAGYGKVKDQEILIGGGPTFEEHYAVTDMANTLMKTPTNLQVTVQAYTSDLKSVSLSRTWTNNRMFRYDSSQSHDGSKTTYHVSQFQARPYLITVTTFTVDLDSTSITRTSALSTMNVDQGTSSNSPTDENVFLYAEAIVDNRNVLAVNARLGKSSSRSLYTAWYRSQCFHCAKIIVQNCDSPRRID